MIAAAFASTDHPLLAHIIPTRRCNLACEYCNEYDDFSKPVPLDEMFRRVDKLAELAKPQIEHTSTDLAVAYRERLMVLDQAIAELRANVDQNRFNASLQVELAGLYRQKQQTLQEILRREHKN